MTELTDRFTAALVHAAGWHAGQRRKHKEVPYLAHLLAVASLVLEDGGTEDEAIAGLLHDTLEDTAVTEATIAALFGDEVARIVVACSDALSRPKPPWLERKTHHVAGLRHADPAVWRVTAADKLHNCGDLVSDVRASGVGTLRGFAGGVEGTCWYYGAMWQVLDERFAASRLTADLGRQVRTLHELAGVTFPARRPGQSRAGRVPPVPRA
ncbi:MAG: HD domain-containing protein [Acidimicrobiales bacterium]